ncbi:MAG: hypothetical protein IEMM0002_0890 [bacterium]|nr:MAG: hypothetical protein IEMM0002_0890 [bacterium]
MRPIIARRNMLEISVTMKRAVVIALVFYAASYACAVKVPPPPVTDSTYFNAKIDQLAVDIMDNASKRVRKAAVLDFVNSNGKTSQLGKYVTKKFSEIAVLNKLFQMPTEGQVAESISRLGLSYTGTLDKISVGKLGEALGVDTLIMGVIADLQKGSDIDLSIQMVETRSGNIVSAASTSFYRSKQVSKLLESF